MFESYGKIEDAVKVYKDVGYVRRWFHTYNIFPINRQSDSNDIKSNNHKNSH